MWTPRGSEWKVCLWPLLGLPPAMWGSAEGHPVEDRCSPFPCPGTWKVELVRGIDSVSLNSFRSVSSVSTPIIGVKW